ncbi:MAG: DUF402 domain-containing protein [Clostridiaceae bacterium]|nr:DUF402 domain-containing protein [Clostridiaceae bacterium]
MKNVRLFRRRFLPDETTELKDDKILSLSENIIVTKWNVLKPRLDISTGTSGYFIDKGIKVSKIYDANHQLVYWYCDIIDTEYDAAANTYTFNDLLIDVLIYPDGQIKVVDMDELADVAEKNILSPQLVGQALRKTQSLLELIYSGAFSDLAKFIDNIEKTATCN